MPRTSPRAHFALLVVQICFGGFHVIGKGLLSELDPLALAGTRVMVAAPILLLASLLVHRERPSRADLPRLALLGMFGVFINQILFIVGLGYTTPVNAAILMPSIPVFAVVFAALLRLEPLTRRSALGVALAVAGALVMVDVSSFDLGVGRTLGNLLVLTNCTSYALYIVLCRPLLERLPPLVVTGWAFLFGSIGVLTVSAPAVSRVSFATLATPTLWGLVYVILVPTTLAYFLNAWALKRSTATVASSYIMLQPVVTTLLSTLFRGETVGRREVAGFILIALGLVIVTGLDRVRRGDSAAHVRLTRPSRDK